MTDLITKLCLAHGTSGCEGSVAKVALDEVSKYADAYIDKNGNVIAQFGNKESNLHIMLDAHIDQIGLVVTDIDENGFIKFAACGGVDKRILPATIVKILGKHKVVGVIGSVPPHLTNANDKKVANINDLFIDTGLDRKNLSKLIEIGDRIVFAQKPSNLLNNRITSPALDDRAGVACLIECAKKLSSQKLNCKISIVFSVQEETGLLGANTATYQLNPDEAIVIDVSFANQPYMKLNNCAKLSGGPMIGIAPIINQNISSQLISIAKEKQLPYQLEVMSGTTSTNADAISITRKGIPCGLISIPLRYMHSPVEVIDITDVKHTADLLSEYILKRGKSE